MKQQEKSGTLSQQNNKVEIKQFFDHVEGSFDTKDTKLIVVTSNKYKEVTLCIKGKGETGCNIPIAEIKLYTDKFYQKMEAYEEAIKLGEEIVRRWNEASDKR